MHALHRGNQQARAGGGIVCTVLLPEERAAVECMMNVAKITRISHPGVPALAGECLPGQRSTAGNAWSGWSRDSWSSHVRI